MQFDTTKPQPSSNEPFPYLEADTYRMEIAAAKETVSKKYFNKDGTPKAQLELDWKVFALTAEQAESGIDMSIIVKQWVAPVLFNSDGTHSKLGQIVAPSLESGELPAQFTEQHLVGLRRKVALGLMQKADGNYFNPVNGVYPLVTPKQQGATPRPINTAASTAGTGIRPNLDDADDIVPKGGYQPTTADYDDMSTKDLRAMAKDLAPKAGRFWAERTDWDDQGRADLVENLDKMSRAIANGETMDAAPELAF